MLCKGELIKHELLSDLYYFTRYFYYNINGKKFIRGNESYDHFKEISNVLERVYRKEITRLVITLPPRHGKTEMAVINFIAKGLALNPKAKFIHASYSDTLALDNSERIRDMVQSEHYQLLFPTETKKDSKSKAKWYTKEGGGVYATSSGGQVTGFGAGIMQEEDKKAIESEISEIEKAQGFGGALVFDDPHKADDVESSTKRNRVINRFGNTFLSRVNSDDTPIISIGQMLHKSDLQNHLISKGWYHLNLPAKNDNGTYLWDYRKGIIDETQETEPEVYDIQYQQNVTKKSNKMPFFDGFDKDRHYIEEDYQINPKLPLDLSFDFNAEPSTCVVGQFNPRNLTWNIFGLHYGASSKKSAIENLCNEIKRTYPEELISRFRFKVVGDATGKKKDPSRPANVNHYVDIQTNLKISKPQITPEKGNIGHVVSRSLCNKVLRSIPKGHFKFYLGTEDLVNDIEDAYRDNNGTLNKAKEDKELGGLHSVDCFRYLVKYWFAPGVKIKTYSKNLEHIKMRILRM